MAWSSLRLLLGIIALMQLKSTLAGDENISFKESLELLRNFCKTCRKPMTKECQKCSSVLRECDPNNGTAPYLGEVSYNVKFNKNKANITWKPINVTDAANWTGYYVMWYKPQPKPTGVEKFDFNGNCVKHSKTEALYQVVTLRDRDWTWPDSLIVYVTTAPMPNYRDYIMYEFWTKAPRESVGLPTEPSKLPVVAIVGGCAGGFLLVLILAGLLGYRSWGGTICTPSEHGFEKDVFISYSREDSEFLQKTVLALLDEHGVRYCIDYKDWLPGIPWQENLLNSIQKSRKVLFIASSSFLNKKNCQKEIEQALYWNGDHSNIIVLRIDSFDKDLLPKTLRGRTFIDYSSKLERLTWQGRLIRALKASSNDSLDMLPDQQSYHALPRNCSSSLSGDIDMKEIV